MAEVTNDLIYESLAEMLGRLVHIDSTLDDVNNRLGLLGGQVSGLSTGMRTVNSGLSNISQSLGSLDRRLMRIEKRLDIVEEPAE